MNGENCLFVSGNTTVRFKVVKVNPKTKYTLKFRSFFQGGESIEENPRLDVLLLPGVMRCVVPERILSFSDADGKAIRQWPPMCNRMPFHRWQEYRDTFYPPERAAFMRLTVRSPLGTTLILDDITFSKTPDEGSININPEFKNGIYDYSGWSEIARGGKLFKLETGKTALDTRYGSRGAFFPIYLPGKYAFSAKARGNGCYNFSIGLNLYNQNGQKTGFFKTTGLSKPTFFFLPPGTVKGRFLIYSSILEKIRIVRVSNGDTGSLRESTKMFEEPKIRRKQ
jgi:hypothetical protein